jgi:hypothetical protein
MFDCLQLYTVKPGTTLERELYREFCRTGNAVTSIQKSECHSCRNNLRWSISTGYLCMNDVSNDDELDKNPGQAFNVLRDGFLSMMEPTTSSREFDFNSMYKATNALRKKQIDREEQQLKNGQAISQMIEMVCV